MITADVAVVGAGVIGLAVALELRRGWGADVLLVDANPAPGQGSTSRANGGVRAQFSTRVNVEFSRYTIERLAGLDAATGGLVGLRHAGYLFLTGTAEGEAYLRAGRELQRACGLDVDWLTPGDVAGLAPYVRIDGLRGATFCATDGTIDPHGVTSALWHECRRLGVRHLWGGRVGALECGDAGVRLRIAGNDVDAGTVVNAAGPDAATVAALAGDDLPVTAYRRSLACTEPVPGLPERIPMCVDLDTGVLVRREGAGCLIAYSDPADEPSSSTAFDPRFLDAVAERMGNRFPFLESAGIDRRKCWAGLYPQTPDHHAVIGHAAVSARLVHCAGFGGHGIMHSLAAGRAAAELVTEGRCTTFDIGPLRPSRFAEGALVMETAVL